MIYSFARPLDVSLVFEDRTYNLGETIDITVQLNTRSDINVRKGRIYLMYDVRWTEAETELQPLGGRLGRGGLRGMAYYTDRVPTGKQLEKSQSYVLGGVEFLRSSHLEPAGINTYSIGLKIHNDDPPYSYVQRASMAWSLVAEVDVIRALDAKTCKDLKVFVS